MGNRRSSKARELRRHIGALRCQLVTGGPGKLVESFFAAMPSVASCVESGVGVLDVGLPELKCVESLPFLTDQLANRGT